MLTTEQITNQTFPHIRRGYDPVAVDRFLERVAKETAGGRSGSLADVGRRRDEILAEAQLEAEQLRRDAEDDLDALRDQHRRVQLEVAEAEAELERLAGDRSHVVGDAGEEAERILVAARAEADALRAEAAAEVEATRATRWEGVGERVTRILSRAEDEAAGLVAEAAEEAEALTAAAHASARTSQQEADAYADQVRQQAEEWAQSRQAAARDDRAQAAEVLDAARAEARRTVADAEGRAANHLAEADEKTRAHVADLLAAARYDLDRLRTEEGRLAEDLDQLATTAQLLLDERSRTRPGEVGTTEQFVPHLMAVDDADEAAGDDEVDAESTVDDLVEEAETA